MRKMSTKEAIRLLDPETTAEAIAEMRRLNPSLERDAAVNAIEKATIIACEYMRMFSWVSTNDRLPELNVPVRWHSSHEFTYEYKVAPLRKTDYGYSVDGSDVNLYDAWHALPMYEKEDEKI